MMLRHLTTTDDIDAWCELLAARGTFTRAEANQLYDGERAQSAAWGWMVNHKLVERIDRLDYNNHRWRIARSRIDAA